MGLTCSKCPSVDPEAAISPVSSSASASSTPNKKKSDCVDPFMHDLMKRSINYTSGGTALQHSTGSGSDDSLTELGQQQLMFKRSKAAPSSLSSTRKASASSSTMVHYPTRLVVRRRHARSMEEGTSGTHIYAIRFPIDQPLKREIAPAAQEQHPRSNPPPPLSSSGAGGSKPSALVVTTNHRIVKPKKLDGKGMASREMSVDQMFTRDAMQQEPKHRVTEWVTVSAEHHIYIVDTGLSALDCDDLIEVTEHACRGQYAAYTYAKQTLGCREFPALAMAARDVVHSVVYSIYERFAGENASRLALDDREPHMVKYDVTKKERQKLDMHTDKSEFTFLIALSNGCGFDFDCGGTYFECLDATIHVQRGHAIVFPGKLRHCGQRISSGVRFLLVGFLVDKTASGKVSVALSSVNHDQTINLDAPDPSATSPAGRAD